MTSISSENEQGGARVIIVIPVIALIIVGALGFLCWNSFVNAKNNEKSDSKQASTATPKPAVSPKSDATKTYDMDGYSFTYPAEGWTVSKIKYGDDDHEPTAVVRTTNFAQTKMGLDSGAEVAINVFAKDGTLSEMKKVVTNFANGTQYKDLKDIKVSGIDAFSYTSDYEGTRYHTVLLNKGIGYDIIYQYGSDENVNTHVAGYNTIVSSLTLK